MKKLFLSILFIFYLSNIYCQEMTYGVDDYPEYVWLGVVMEEYQFSYFFYPQNIQDIIEFWLSRQYVYDEVIEPEYQERTIRLLKDKEHLYKIIDNDSIYQIKLFQDTIVHFQKINECEEEINAFNNTWLISRRVSIFDDDRLIRKQHEDYFYFHRMIQLLSKEANNHNEEVKKFVLVVYEDKTLKSYCDYCYINFESRPEFRGVISYLDYIARRTGGNKIIFYYPLFF